MSGLLFENNKHTIAKVRENANRHNSNWYSTQTACAFHADYKSFLIYYFIPLSHNVTKKETNIAYISDMLMYIKMDQL